MAVLGMTQERFGGKAVKLRGKQDGTARSRCKAEDNRSECRDANEESSEQGQCYSIAGP